MRAGNAYTPMRAGLVGDTYTLANESADGTKDRDLVSLNMAVPVSSVTDMRDNPKTINRSGVYIYNYNLLLYPGINSIAWKLVLKAIIEFLGMWLRCVRNICDCESVTETVSGMAVETSCPEELAKNV